MAAAWRAATLAILLTLAGTGPIAVRAKGAEQGAWSKVPHLLQAHVGHTATLLPDGRVLLAGGTNARGVATASCELFDPKANRWIPAASMNSARIGHTATLLSDGNVLVTGGQTGLGIFPIDHRTSAPIYHPASNAWTPAASMHVPRAWHSAHRLPDGRVLVVAGVALLPADSPPRQDGQAEIYDAALDNWSPAGAGLPPLSQAAATLMANGSVLVTGGSVDWGFATTSAFLFDLATNRWQPTTWPMANARYAHTATLLRNGKVLLLGGYTTKPETVGGRTYRNRELLKTSEIFDLGGNTGIRIGYSEIPRLEHTATLLLTGTVLVVGSAFASSADSQILDPSNTEHWISTGMPMDRYLHTATLLADGRVLIAGGYGVGSPSTAWIFSPAAGPFSPSLSLSPTMRVTAVLFLFVLIALGFAATSGRLRRRGTRSLTDADSEWIDPR